MKLVKKVQVSQFVELKLYEDDESYGYRCIAFENGQQSGWEFEESDLESAIGTMDAEIKRGIQLEWI